MKNNTATHIVIILFIILISGANVFAIKLSDKMNLSFSERFRFLSWDNAITLDKDTASANSFTRHRTSIGLQYKFSSNIAFHTKLTNEFRKYFVPENRQFSFHEVIFDQLNVKATHNTYPITITAGRQNIILGEGFVMMDGGPLDGSRTVYFNAIRADYKIGINKTLTAFYCNQSETDDWLPIIHNQDTPMIEQPEEGYGLYYTGKYNKFNVQSYYIKKTIDSTENIALQSEINTMGGKINWAISAKTNFVFEGAYQFGKLNDIDRKAFGGYSYLKFSPNRNQHGHFTPQNIMIGAIFLSGDNPETEEYEDWDPVFARWPKWSESYIYTQILEDNVAYWTNLNSLYSAMVFKPNKNIRLDLQYYHLMAYYKLQDGLPFSGGSGATRGNLFIGNLSYSFNKKWSGHILWEGFIPGDYYIDSADSYNWLRTELMFKL